MGPWILWDWLAPPILVPLTVPILTNSHIVLGLRPRDDIHILVVHTLLSDQQSVCHTYHLVSARSSEEPAKLSLQLLLAEKKSTWRLMIHFISFTLSNTHTSACSCVCGWLGLEPTNNGVSSSYRGIRRGLQPRLLATCYLLDRTPK